MRSRNFDNYTRLPFEELSKLVPALKKKRIAKNLSEKKSILMANFYECLLDPQHKLPEKDYEIFTFIEDMGVKMMQIGSKGGGYYAPYRRFRILFKNTELIAGIGLNCYLNKARSLICVTLQKGEKGKPHHALQLAVDDYLRLRGKYCSFTHKGSIGLGALGTGKNSVLREKYVKPLYPKILAANGYMLGSLDTKKLWYLDDKSVTNFVENLISYSIARDMYRDDAKRAAGLI